MSKFCIPPVLKNYYLKEHASTLEGRDQVMKAQRYGIVSKLLFGKINIQQMIDDKENV